ncbi:MAG: triose-phosphate isomerase [Bacteroidetes bacterium GWA2_31_9]|nr:MAG: triose-phosphate isomerase [Bacteroidetes bacterium GWA2_31_9]
MRKNIVAGNWKMNKTIEEGVQLVKEIKSLISEKQISSVQLIINPPFTHLSVLKNEIANSVIKIGAQNCSYESSGAYTGEVSVGMLKSIDIDYVIIGHSERRAYFNETDEILLKKLNLVLESGLLPIFCCGEVLSQRDAGIHFEVVRQQIENTIFKLSEDKFKKVVIAYEPVWAIGTGRTATSEQAQEIHKYIRNLITEKFGSTVASEISILYGGSCNAQNAKELFQNPDVDGGLIGGASLKAADFVQIASSF